MPTMPRLSGKSTKIAYKIMGTPPNLKKQKVKAKEEKRINKRLIFEETDRAR